MTVVVGAREDFTLGAFRRATGAARNKVSRTR
jgi:hypothetical protein